VASDKLSTSCATREHAGNNSNVHESALRAAAAGRKLAAASWAHLCVVVGDLAEQVVGHVCVSNAVEEDVQDAVAAAWGTRADCSCVSLWEEAQMLHDNENMPSQRNR
jgi:hypothetical protein